MPSKKPRLQLYADECFPVPVVTYLKSQGYSIIHAYDKNYIQKPDNFHLGVSRKLGKVLITLDRDFLYYGQTSLRSFPGVIVISAGSTTPPHIINICRKALKNINQELVKESLIKITMDKLIRIKGQKVVFQKLF
ncbi:MAG: DUF5615 family PIN-like protein [Candidatus Daviesbacteria bacterium]|nr:DUF5615 family PIN-like protein [Candidatus Daviesbacteria bacterium]